MGSPAATRERQHQSINQSISQSVSHIVERTEETQVSCRLPSNFHTSCIEVSITSNKYKEPPQPPSYHILIRGRKTGLGQEEKTGIEQFRNCQLTDEQKNKSRVGETDGRERWWETQHAAKGMECVSPEKIIKISGIVVKQLLYQN